jgi:hypothetical protein
VDPLIIISKMLSQISLLALGKITQEQEIDFNLFLVEEIIGDNLKIRLFKIYKIV